MQVSSVSVTNHSDPSGASAVARFSLDDTLAVDDVDVDDGPAATVDFASAGGDSRSSDGYGVVGVLVYRCTRSRNPTGDIGRVLTPTGLLSSHVPLRCNATDAADDCDELLAEVAEDAEEDVDNVFVARLAGVGLQVSVPGDMRDLPTGLFELISV